MTALDNGGAAKRTGLADARDRRDVEQEDNRYKALTADEAMLTNSIPMTENCELYQRYLSKSGVVNVQIEIDFFLFFHQVPGCEKRERSSFQVCVNAYRTAYAKIREKAWQFC